MNKVHILLLVVFGIMNIGCEADKSKEVAVVEKPKKVSIGEIEQGIKDYIDKKIEEENGYFHLDNNGEPLKLKLVRVHTEFLSDLGHGRQFACVDLADISGEVFDVDFFMEGVPGDMNVTETTVHKLNGKPYYSWKQNKTDKTWFQVPMEQSENDLLGVKEGEDQFEFYYELQLPQIEKEANLWIPMASSDAYQEVEVVSIEGMENKQLVVDEKNGNKILFAKMSAENSNSTIRVTYKVDRKEKAPYAAEDKGMNQYLEGIPLLPVGGRFSTIINEILAGKEKDNELVKARAIYDYIIDNMSYKKAGIYGTGDANYACDSKSGNCTEFHSLFISLARTANIPARFGVGASIPSDRDEGGVDGYHCWAEFYAEGKWWPVDISEANKYTALATYYFGHHPANRIELSKGRDLQLDPGPLAGPINFLAYPVFEMNGEQMSVKTTFSFKRGEG